MSSRPTSARRSPSSPTSTPALSSARPTCLTCTWYRSCSSRKGWTRSCEKLGIDTPRADLAEWNELAERIETRRDVVQIALVGKYVKLHDAYLRARSAQARGCTRAAGCRCAGSTPSTCRTKRPSASSTRSTRPRAGRVRVTRLGARSWRAAWHASARSRTWASASACTSLSPSSHATSAAWRARTRPRWIPRRPIR